MLVLTSKVQLQKQTLGPKRDVSKGQAFSVLKGFTSNGRPFEFEKVIRSMFWVGAVKGPP